MVECMTDKQYEGMLKDSIACLDRVAEHTKDKDALKALLYERKLIESKLGYPFRIITYISQLLKLNKTTNNKNTKQWCKVFY